jgi:hypothetical protein
MIPSNTDLGTLSEVSRLTGEYLPKIAGATEPDRKKLLCEFVSQIYDIWTEQRAKLFKSQEDLPDFKFELDTHLSRVVMPLLGPIRLSDPELEAIELALAGRRQHWLGVVATRVAPAENQLPDPSATTSDQSLSMRTEGTGAARTGSDPIAKERKRSVDAYIAEARCLGIQITRTDIWKKAAYKTRTEFERWERNDRRATQTANKNITRVLTEKPHLRKPTRP